MRKLLVRSVLPAQGIHVLVSPPDQTGATDGVTPAWFEYENDTRITVQVDQEFQREKQTPLEGRQVTRYSFNAWRENLEWISFQPTLEVNLDRNRTFKVDYACHLPPWTPDEADLKLMRFQLVLAAKLAYGELPGTREGRSGEWQVEWNGQRFTGLDQGVFPSQEEAVRVLHRAFHLLKADWLVRLPKHMADWATAEHTEPLYLRHWIEREIRLVQVP